MTDRHEKHEAAVSPSQDRSHEHHASQMKPMKTDRLLLMAAAHFVMMFVLMYAMVDKLADIFPNLNQVYMAGIMTAPMLIMETLLMGAMYANKQALRAIAAISGILLIAFFLFIRQQTAITDGEFLRAMIPHHSGAVLMCQNASLQDPEIKALCQSIIASQQSEIDQMRRILDRLK
jgi:uncharacterized protein (DUF305 family)